MTHPSIQEPETLDIHHSISSNYLETGTIEHAPARLFPLYSERSFAVAQDDVLEDGVCPHREDPFGSCYAIRYEV